MHIIWSNDYDTIKDIKNEIAPEYSDITENRLFEYACEINNEYLEDEKVNLDKELGNHVVMLGELGLWNGPRKGYRILKGTNLNDCLSGTVGDYIKWYVDDDGEVKCQDTHHDGTNMYIYRVLKPGITSYEFEEEAFDDLEKAFEKYTDKLGDYVKEIYGWED